MSGTYDCPKRSSADSILFSFGLLGYLADQQPALAPSLSNPALSLCLFVPLHLFSPPKAF